MQGEGEGRSKRGDDQTNGLKKVFRSSRQVDGDDSTISQLDIPCTLEMKLENGGDGTSFILGGEVAVVLNVKFGDLEEFLSKGFLGSILTEQTVEALRYPVPRVIEAAEQQPIEDQLFYLERRIGGHSGCV